MADISDYYIGDKMRVIVPNSKSIPIGTIVTYTGYNKRCCGGTYKMGIIIEGASEQTWGFDHWFEKVI